MWNAIRMAVRSAMGSKGFLHSESTSSWTISQSWQVFNISNAMRKRQTIWTVSPRKCTSSHCLSLSIMELPSCACALSAFWDLLTFWPMVSRPAFEDTILAFPEDNPSLTKLIVKIGENMIWPTTAWPLSLRTEPLLSFYVLGVMEGHQPWSCQPPSRR